MKLAVYSLAFLFCFAGSGPSALAFGRAGHQITGALAMHFLSVKANKAVRQLLGATTPEQASVWMDEMRELKEYKFMSSWHYINAPKGTVYKPGRADLYSTLDSVVKVLRARDKYTRAQQKQSLLIFFHLMGDLHQPLHTGYLADHGGNDVIVRFGAEESNLHSVWDGGIIRDQKISLTSCLLRYNGAGNVETYKAESKKARNYLTWIEESRSKLPGIYAFSGSQLPADYARRNAELLERQLLRAGMRMALILESVYG